MIVKIFKPFSITFLTTLIIGLSNPGTGWKSIVFKKYTYNYTAADSANTKEYIQLINKGIKDAALFFGDTFKSKFGVFIHPNRSSLDSTWQKDWNMPAFTSECWMVASGTALKLDLISPKTWDKVACEHKYAHKKKTQQLITHELIHVYHGQLNTSPDFSNTEKIDWFVEGLATYASGQCDTTRINEIKKAIAQKTIPQSLDNFWTGQLRYGLSGLMVMYIDKKYGRKKLKELMPLTKKNELLQALHITESDLLEAWLQYIMKL